MLWLCVLSLGACADDAGDTTPAPEMCGQNTPLVSWETFGEGFLTTYCQGCHASTTLDRQGAPEMITFDTEADALQWRGEILAAAASEAPSMPPNGGPNDADRERLQVWLNCFADSF